VDLTLECTSVMNYYMILRVTAFDLAAILEVKFSRLLSRKIRNDLD